MSSSLRYHTSFEVGLICSILVAAMFRNSSMSSTKGFLVVAINKIALIIFE
ncbi:hypothetical protein PU02_0893 [Bartonella ancashensis]|uniref:Uncharacterized protein n=1 Tax=Bartonella ancashensis TaxID=1318743 RepID=A0A0M4LGU0_9HYPH|nr:hypothetical protein PU02_0893 [Bartonella ancashensis]